MSYEAVSSLKDIIFSQFTLLSGVLRLYQSVRSSIQIYSTRSTSGDPSIPVRSQHQPLCCGGNEQWFPYITLMSTIIKHNSTLLLLGNLHWHGETVQIRSVPHGRWRSQHQLLELNPSHCWVDEQQVRRVYTKVISR